jgi:hypothetical protein
MTMSRQQTIHHSVSHPQRSDQLRVWRRNFATSIKGDVKATQDQDLDVQDLLAGHGTREKIRKTFDDSSTCCSTICMEDSMSSLKVSSQHPVVGVRALQPSQEQQVNENDDHESLLSHHGDDPQTPKDCNRHCHHEKSMSSDLEVSSRTLTSFSYYSSRGEESEDVSVAQTTNKNDDQDEYEGDDDDEVDGDDDGDDEILPLTTRLRPDIDVVVRVYRRRRGYYHHKIRNTIQATSMHIKSLPRELEIAAAAATSSTTTAAADADAKER